MSAILTILEMPDLTSGHCSLFCLFYKGLRVRQLPADETSSWENNFIIFLTYTLSSRLYRPKSFFATNKILSNEFSTAKQPPKIPNVSFH